ncbi:threonine/serine ThrE exporter family protein [Cryptosporangium japonicum]|uniref:Threonine/serine exporter family protein n=1 Tax=Cryptosporangium japonicum TaxID=80872 RepID=A0ABP3DXI6_9ACTN
MRPGAIVRWARGNVASEAQVLLRGGEPTVELLRHLGPDVPTDAQVLEVLDLCIQVGEVLLSTGEPVGETAATMTRLAAACGLPTVDVDVTFNAITMCFHRGNVAAPVTTMRLAGYGTTDLTRIDLITGIVDQVTRSRMTVPAAVAAVSEAVNARHPYPRWVATVGMAGLAAAVAVLLGGSALIAATAFVVTALIDRLGFVLQRRDVAPFFRQVAGALLTTVATLGLLASGALPADTQPSLVIAAGLTALLSGLTVVGTVQDAISGYYVTAAGRAAEITLLSAGLLAGVILGLQLGLVFDLDLDPAEPLRADMAGFVVSTVAAAASAALFALAGYAPLRSLPAAFVVGGAAWAAYAALTLFTDVGSVAASGVAATVVGLATGLSRRGSGRRTPVIVLSGIIPLLPGLTAYRGFYELAVHDVVNGLVTLVLALTIGLAVAAGVALGDLVARPAVSRRRARPRTRDLHRR